MVFNIVSDERFRIPVTTTELEEFGRSWSSDNSRRKWGKISAQVPTSLCIHSFVSRKQ